MAWICVLWWVLALACALTAEISGVIASPERKGVQRKVLYDVKGIEIASILVRDDIYILYIIYIYYALIRVDYGSSWIEAC